MQHLIHTFAWFDLSTKEHVIVENMYLFLKGSSSPSTLPQIHIFTDEFEIVGGFFLGFSGDVAWWSVFWDHRYGGVVLIDDNGVGGDVGSVGGMVVVVV